MRSEQMSIVSPGDHEYYSDLKVMKSGAGYYIGTSFDHPAGWSEPGTRDSRYFRTEEEATEELKAMEAGQTPDRIHP